LSSPEVIDTESDQAPNNLYYFPVEDKARSVSATLRITYKSTSGKETKRDVDVKMFYRGEGGCHFEGFDHLRKARRRLSSKSVLTAINLESGEFITDLCSFFERNYIRNLDYSYDMFFEKHGQEIYALVYVAAADGAVRASERALIISYCLNRDGFGKLSKDRLEKIIRELYRISEHEFRKIIKQLKSKQENYAELISTTIEISTATTKPNEDRKKAVDYLVKQLNATVKTRLD
jgi:uncharacterized tellurite resistance protein B-like protein